MPHYMNVTLCSKSNLVLRLRLGPHPVKVTIRDNIIYNEGVGLRVWGSYLGPYLFASTAQGPNPSYGGEAAGLQGIKMPPSMQPSPDTYYIQRIPAVVIP